MRKTLLISTLLGAGCAFEPPPAEVPEPVPVVPLDPPELVSMMRPEIRVGEPLAFAGHGFLPPAEGHVDVTFRGTFSPYGARPVEVNHTGSAAVTADGLLEMRFGPFVIPFTRAGNEHGIFSGKLFATNRSHDGRARRQPEETWPEVELTVLSSIVVRALAPKEDPDLAIGPPDVVERTPYVLAIETVGADPVAVEYRLGPNVLIDGSHIDVVTHDALGPVDVLGDTENLSFDAVPDGVKSVPAAIVVYVLTQTGETISFELDAIIHRGVEVRSGG